MLRQARKRFPKAVILYTGYFFPFAPGVSNSAIQKLFEFLSQTEGWKLFVNNKLIELKDVDQLVIEAQHRSQFGLSRGLYWSRMAVVELATDAQLRGPGILFIHPKFGRDNTVFAQHSFFHKEYKLSEVNDPLKTKRYRGIVRREFLDDMKSLRNKLLTSAYFETKLLSEKMFKELDGPANLLNALLRHSENPSISTRDDLRWALGKEIERITDARRASFLHPNKKRAERYTDEIERRYRERLHRVNLTNDIIKFKNVSGGNEAEKVKGIMRRYNLESYNISPANASQLMLVDSIALEVDTAADSEERMFDDIFLHLGNNTWQLNFPYWYAKLAINPPQAPYILHPQFRPSKRDLFTIDGNGMHLSSITGMEIERKSPYNLSTIGRGLWKFARIALFLNGLKVFSSNDGHLARNSRHEFASFPRNA